MSSDDEYPVHVRRPLSESSESEDEDLPEMGVVTKRVTRSVSGASSTKESPETYKPAEPQRAPLVFPSSERKYKNSVTKLLLENPDQTAETKQEMLELHKELRESIQRGGFVAELAQVHKEERNAELLAEHEEKLKLYMPNTSEIPHRHPGIKVFPNPPNFSLLDVKMNRALCPGDDFYQMFIQADEPGKLEILLGGWITTHYSLSKGACPDAVAKWLFATMCTHPDGYVSSACLTTLRDLMLVFHKRKDGTNGIIWTPNLSDFVRALCAYGATQRSVAPMHFGTHMGKRVAGAFSPRALSRTMSTGSTTPTRSQGDPAGASEPQTMDTAEDEGEEGTDEVLEPSFEEEETRDQSPPFFENLSKLLQYIAIAVQLLPSTFNKPDIPTTVTIIARVALGYNLVALNPDASTCIAALLEYIADADWDSSREWLVGVLQEISSHHHDLLYVVSLMPPTQRGQQLATHLAINIISKLGGAAAGDGQVVGATLDDLLKGMTPINVTDDTDYYKLFCIVALIDKVIVNEDPEIVKNTPKIKALQVKLQEWNNKVRDRGQALDRTVAKDMIIRTYAKLALMERIARPGSKQRSLTDFFTKVNEDTDVQVMEP